MSASPPQGAGRSCPLHYRYPPSVFDAERGNKRLLFNGDFHWFDADPAVFDRIQRSVQAHHAVRGNVETELAAEAAADDASSLAGWGFAQEHLREASHRDAVRAWFGQAGVDVFACTHTCLPVFQSLRTGGSVRWVCNNGAAGMPNFKADRAGLLTRISVHPFAGPQRRFGVKHGDVFIDAIGIEVDALDVRRRFVAQWPPGSDAHQSYFDRITLGPTYAVEDAVRSGDTPAPPLNSFALTESTP